MAAGPQGLPALGSTRQAGAQTGPALAVWLVCLFPSWPRSYLHLSRDISGWSRHPGGKYGGPAPDSGPSPACRQPRSRHSLCPWKNRVIPDGGAVLPGLLASVHSPAGLPSSSSFHLPTTPEALILSPPMCNYVQLTTQVVFGGGPNGFFLVS